jgi:hypothetical protein
MSRANLGQVAKDLILEVRDFGDSLDNKVD